ncbi:unnamed protein product [Schistosoma mattheei]|uniref:Uncharacterized protein n=1 Tax=Schistosoma mattheei TaxID=31246 RepID=A0A183PG70_9TREM|nr:unnamed protein product [Schistosoma mattheei]
MCQLKLVHHEKLGSTGWPSRPVTPFESANVGNGSTPHLLLDDSVSNLRISSTSRSESVNNIKSGLDNISEQLKESERPICALTRFRNARIISVKTTNQRLTQKHTSNENNAVGITINPIASAAGPTDAVNLFHASQYSDLPKKSANLPLIPVVTSGNQCTSNGDINPISSSATLEAHNQIPSSDMKAHKTLLILKNLYHIGRKYIQNRRVSNLMPKVLSWLYHTKIYFPAPFYPTNRRGGYIGTLSSNIAQDGHYNLRVSRPNIRQTAKNQRIPRLPSKVLNIKPARCNFCHHFPNRQDRLLDYVPSTQPQQAGSFLNCPPIQVQ